MALTKKENANANITYHFIAPERPTSEVEQELRRLLTEGGRRGVAGHLGGRQVRFVWHIVPGT